MTDAAIRGEIPFFFPVEFDDGRGVLAGHFHPARGERHGVLQVLVHGTSYDHRYWDAGRFDGHGP